MRTPIRHGNIPLLLAAILVAAAAGWLARGTRPTAARSLALADLPPVEALTLPTSFSEVENTRARLNELASRALSEARIAALPGTHVRNRPDPGPADADPRIARLRRHLVEFRGTSYEFLFLQDLLLLHQARGDHDLWIDLYLEALYRNPTHGLVASFAADAVRIGRLAGRQPEVELAFRHVLDIPVEFSTRDRLEAAADLPSPPSA